MWIPIVVGLTVGTLAFRLAGPLIGGVWRPGRRLESGLAMAATVMLAALVATSTVGAGADTGPSAARIAGVVLACAAAWRGLSLPWLVIAAAAVTAGLRVLGVP